METIIILLIGLVIIVGGYYWSAGKGMEGAIKYWGALALYAIGSIGYVLITRF